ncbi:hypothetical protein ACWF94_16430 [Streptomyces sp. NPDC055078]
MSDTVRLVPVFDPVLRNFAVQLWKDGDPAGIHGLIETYTHPADLLATVNRFLTEAGVRPLTRTERATLRRELITAKDGPEPAPLWNAEPLF